LELDERNLRVVLNSTPIPLRNAQFQLLLYLVERPLVWVSQQTLLSEVFGATSTYETALVRVHVHTLRRALGEYAQCIESSRGRGYRFRDVGAA
jgi:two-component system phosphate regulon response regulator PhoB